MRTMPMQWGKGPSYSETACAACGKTLNPNRLWAVHVINGGSEIVHPADDHLYVSDGGEMGCHFVGPECRKQFGDFAFRWNAQ